MKNSLNYSIVFLVFIFFSCHKTKQNFVPNCTTNSTYSVNVQPIIRAYCVSCHPSYSSYTQVAAYRNSIRSRIIDGSMPQGSSLSDTQKNAVICWIDTGAQNN